MKKAVELKYLDNLWRKLDYSLQNYFETADEEELHQFRVQVKKIKAFLTLIDKSSNSRQLLKAFKPVKKAYQFTGQIRNLNINIQLADTYGLANQAFVNEQKRMLDVKIGHFRQQADIIMKQMAKVRKKLLKKLHGVQDDDLEALYSKNLYLAAYALTRSGFTDKLHNCRKQIKFLIYNGPMVNYVPEINTHYLDGLQHEIGVWHDNVLLLQCLSPAKSSHQNIINDIQYRVNVFENAITSQLSNFWKKAIAVS